MKRPKTLRSYLKILYVLEATPLEDLKGFIKLSDDEQRTLVGIGADLSNGVNDHSIESIREKLKLTKQS